MALHFDRSLEPHYGMLERLSPLVARLLAPNPSPFTFRGTGVYIVGAGDQVAVIDPGPDLPEHIAALTTALRGKTVSHILVTHTHRDHSPPPRAEGSDRRQDLWLWPAWRGRRQRGRRRPRLRARYCGR